MSGNDFDTVPQCFQIPAKEKPGFFAVRSGAERLTYAGLDARSDALCDRLTAAAVEKGALAGILLDRSLSTITSFLAVLKAGGAVVPLDLSGTPQGILDIIQRHKLTCVISNGATLRCFPQLAAAVPVIDVDAAPLAGPTGRRGEAVKVAGSDPACVMFPSGSTGEPKGVVIPHRAILRLVKNPGYMRVSPDQTFVQASPLAFDASIFEIWGALLNGTELVILPAGLRSPETIAAAIAEQGVTTLFLASCLFNLMIDQPSPPHKLLYLVSGGNVMPPARAGDGGELFAVGDGVAFGFLDRPDLMTDEFITDHFGADPRRRMCRTGEVVSQRADGLVEIGGDPKSGTGTNGERVEVFWKEKLQALVEPTLLGDALSGTSGHHPGRTPDAGGHGRVQTRLSVEKTGRLARFARQEGVTPNTILQGAWLLLLQRYCGQRTVAFGVAFAERLAHLPGAGQPPGLVHILPIVHTPRPEQLAGDWLRALQSDILAMREIQHASLGHIQRLAGRSGEALFDSIIVFETCPVDEAPRHRSGAMPGLSAPERFDTTLYAIALNVRAGEQLEIGYSYPRERFDAEQISALQAHMLQLIDEITADAGRALGNITLLTPDERTKILDAWSLGKESFNDAACLHELIEAQVREQPGATAVVYEDASLTYGELNARANRLARHLRSLGVGPDVLVGLAVERSLEMVVGLLGILKAGGAYVPLDPAYPAERLAYMLEDARLALVLTQEHLLSSLTGAAKDSSSAAKFWRLDRDWPEIEHHSDADLVNLTRPQDLAYCIYTSGSTGRPKGVLLTHLNAVRLFQATQPWFDFDRRDVWTMFHSLAFDFSVWELFGALTNGGKLVVVPYRTSRSPEDFLDLLRREQVTVLNQTPSAFRQLTRVAGLYDEDGAKLHLRYVVFGGEALDAASLRPWFDHFGDRHPLLINMYGITETTVHVTYRPLRVEDLNGSAIPIGRAIPDLSPYILDLDMTPVPVGIAGELYIGGAGLARGYLGRPELTAERFVGNPFAQKPGERLYRTGDLARWRANGEIEYVGRIDHQVKIRGFRIELGEIEARLLAHDGVREAVVSAREGTSGKQLVGYVVAVPGAQERRRTPAGPASAGAFVEQLKEHLRAGLPDYMIPSRLLVLERMPLTPSGKIDRKALPVPPASFGAEARLKPRASDVEATLAGIYARLLNLADVDLDTNFFDLGGTSLDLVALHEVIRERFERNFPVTTLFEYSTIRALAAHLHLQTQDPARPPEAGKLQMADIRNRKLRQNEALQRLGRNRARPAL
ncbi:MAG TPA: amino acid adenylation domain-containing protein [Methylocella sp.]|jgi:amino acid adenylation domain-containing protein|nr:amino acid adenylation domain-containing protein [Methylocella sp.]